MADIRIRRQVNWQAVIWITVIHAVAFLGPFTFSWSGLVLCAVFYVATMLGITMGYHRLLTHRSYQTPRIIEYLLTILGSLATQGGPLQWVSTHRAHHAHTDQEGDPHSPIHGGWWSHVLWAMSFDPVTDDPEQRRRYVRDLVKDPIHRFLNRCQIPFQIIFGVGLFFAGEAWGGVGVSWVVWGQFVRIVLTSHAVWFVNSATHRWGYRSHETRDLSTNLWWVAFLCCGEGWHNNHHAFPRSARHGLRWWEFDMTYVLIRMMSFVRLARQIHLPGRIIRPTVDHWTHS